MAAETAEVAVAAPTDVGFKRELGLIGATWASETSIIGSGWLFGALFAAQAVGGAAVIAWVIAGVIVIVLALATPSSARCTRSPADGQFPSRSHDRPLSYAGDRPPDEQSAWRSPPARRAVFEPGNQRSATIERGRRSRPSCSRASAAPCRIPGRRWRGPACGSRASPSTFRSSRDDRSRTVPAQVRRGPVQRVGAELRHSGFDAGEPRGATCGGSRIHCLLAGMRPARAPQLAQRRAESASARRT